VKPYALAKENTQARSRWIPAFAGMTSCRVFAGMASKGKGEERDPGSGEARPVLSLSKGQDDVKL
jgi:hypothetical protein